MYIYIYIHIYTQTVRSSMEGWWKNIALFFKSFSLEFFLAQGGVKNAGHVFAASHTCKTFVPVLVHNAYRISKQIPTSIQTIDTLLSSCTRVYVMPVNIEVLSHPPPHFFFPLFLCFFLAFSQKFFFFISLFRYIRLLQCESCDIYMYIVIKNLKK